MKKLTRYISLFLALIIVLTSLVSCEKEPGLYNWLGAKIDVDNVLIMKIDTGDGTTESIVPFDLYHGLFMYYAKVVSTGTIEGEDGKLIFTDAKEQTKAIKEYIEDVLMEFYALDALAKRYGVELKDEDYSRFKTDYLDAMRKYLENNNLTEYLEVLDNDPDSMYDRLFKSLGTTKSYFEFQYLHQLLSSRIKRVICPNILDFARKNYTHMKQVIITYNKGNAASEQEAYSKIQNAYSELQNGAAIDEIIKKYDSGIGYNEIYFDSNSSIVGSTTSESVSSFISMTVGGLRFNEYSDILSGDYDGDTGYFAIIQRLDFDEDMLYGESTIGNRIYGYYSVSSNQLSPQLSEYNTLLDSYEQNIVCYPYDSSIYNKINVKTMR